MSSVDGLQHRRGPWQIRRWLALLAVVAASCTSPVQSQGEELPAQALVVTGGTVIDGTGADPTTEGMVAIYQGRVVSVGRAADFLVPSEAEVIDVAGGMILPGFIDAHVHETADPAVRRDFLEGGVTSVCAMGSRIEDMPAYEEESLGDLPVARALQAGPIMTAPDGAPDIALDIGYNYEVATPEEARAGVGDLLERGADVIKIYLVAPQLSGQEIPVLDQARVATIVDEAHTRGVLVRAHITEIGLVGMALEAGVDVVDHLPWLALTEEKVADITASDDPIQQLRDLLNATEMGTVWAEMVAAGTVMVPTLERVVNARFRTSQPSDFADEALRLYLDSVRQFHQAGGVIALGTDFNVNIGMTRGIPIGELQLLVEAGLTPTEAIEAGTRHAAHACGHQPELGTLEPGKIGDLIVVSGDPLQNISALSDISLVIKDGAIAHQAP